MPWSWELRRVSLQAEGTAGGAEGAGDWGDGGAWVTWREGLRVVFSCYPPTWSIPFVLLERSLAARPCRPPHNRHRAVQHWPLRGRGWQCTGRLGASTKEPCPLGPRRIFYPSESSWG